MNFILSSSTYLRYFAPIILEANKRNIQSNFFLAENRKYDSVFKDRNFNQIQNFSKVNKVNLYNLNDINNFTGTTFVIEGDRSDVIDRNKHLIISITYHTDFTILLKKYINFVDYVMMPSASIAKKYNLELDKNLYFGLPKYDYIPNKNDALKRYQLNSDKKYCLVIAPRNRDVGKLDMVNIFSRIKQLGYEILVKTRGKDPVHNKLQRGDHYFEDTFWFPHTTMDLIHISDFVVNFESTAIKECVLLKTPVINFKCKPFDTPLKFLYDYDYCLMIDDSSEDFTIKLKKLLKQDNLNAFNDSIKENLFEPGHASKKILDFIERKIK